MPEKEEGDDDFDDDCMCNVMVMYLYSEAHSRVSYVLSYKSSLPILAKKCSFI